MPQSRVSFRAGLSKYKLWWEAEIGGELGLGRYPFPRALVGGRA